MRLFRPLEDILIADRGSRQRAAEQFVAVLVGIGRSRLIVSHDSVVTSLKRLLKQDLLAIDPSALVSYGNSESDRTAIILSAATLEQILVWQLEARMVSLNQDEKDRLFHYEGPCGSFSSRIRMAQAFGIIDRATRRRIELIKEMRNVCAHCHAPLNFSTPAIKSAVVQLYGSPSRKEIQAEDASMTRALFVTLATRMARDISANELTDPTELYQSVRGKQTTLTSWPEISPGP